MLTRVSNPARVVTERPTPSMRTLNWKGGIVGCKGSGVEATSFKVKSRARAEVQRTNRQYKGCGNRLETIAPLTFSFLVILFDEKGE